MLEPLTDLQLAAASNDDLLAAYKALRQELTRAREQLNEFHSLISKGWPNHAETEVEPISPASEPDKLLYKLRRSVRVVCVPRFYPSDKVPSDLTAKALLRVRQVIISPAYFPVLPTAEIILDLLHCVQGITQHAPFIGDPICRQRWY